MPDKLVESTNKLDVGQLFAKHFPKDSLLQLQADVRSSTSSEVTVAHADARSLTPIQLKACLDLVEQTSADDYRTSESGWSRTKKRKEMKLPDLRYLMLSVPTVSDDNSGLAGFISFMITYEDGNEVIYIYEIHLCAAWRGKGVGKHLMRAVETIGANVGVEKAMLTVFKANERAVQWYRKSGYATDEFSPPARRLRNGVVKEPTYVILSKPFLP
jgi:N-alpha-acetyltransferase 40